jgi:hypothetical protein
LLEQSAQELGFLHDLLHHQAFRQVKKRLEPYLISGNPALSTAPSLDLKQSHTPILSNSNDTDILASAYHQNHSQ